MPELPLTTSYDEGTGVLTVGGDIDADSTPQLLQAIEDCSRQHTTDLVVDLTRVTYLPSVTLGMLVRSIESFRAAGGTLELAARAGSLAQRVLTVSAMPFRAS